MGIYFTTQKREVIEGLNSSGCLVGNRKFVPEFFLSSYQWMKKQMKVRIDDNSEAYPIWLWKDKPDLNEEGHFSSGTKSVCLTIDIPDETVLLSDFHAWHCVLNNWFCAMSEEEERLFEEGRLHLTKEQSWERIFDLEAIKNSEIWKVEKPVIQGVTPKVLNEQILEIEYFIAK